MLKQELGSATPVGCCQNQGVKRCQMATLVMTVSVSKIYVLRDILCLCLILDPHGYCGIFFTVSNILYPCINILSAIIKDSHFNRLWAQNATNAEFANV